MLADRLWQDNQDLAQACLNHPFIQGLAAGDLDPACFGAYVAQDAFFLRAFVQAYALALVRCPDSPEFLTLIQGVSSELQMHSIHALEFRINLTKVTPNRACRAYTDFLLHTAWHRDLPEILASMTPCMRLYAWLGASLAPGRGLRYQRWIDSYSGPNFRALAARLEALLDRHATDTPSVREHYRYAMECEFDFFTDAMSREGASP